jgi:hypothetical protein
MAFRSPTLRFAVGLLGFLAVASITTPPAVMQAPASQWLSLNIVRIKPDRIREYVEFQKSETIPALKKAGQTGRDAWRTATFGETYQIAYISRIRAFEQYDTPNPIIKALGEAGYQAYLAKVRPMIEGQTIQAVRTRPDLSYVANPATRPTLGILTTVDVHGNKLLDFEAYLKNEWIPALKKGGGTHYEVLQVMYGGLTTQYMTFVGLSNFAELDKGHPVTRALGEAGLMQMMAKHGGFAQRIERSIIRLDPELSFSAN